jgi:2-polyprenyl-3-methyl-5-hydroxy-6-metoxy-1,4-benzoquinol methylase
MSFYQRLLGHPFVYDRIRPLVVGGIDWSPLYRNLGAGAGDVILDVGCGTGVAHQYLSGFGAYHGFDTDEVAVKTAAARTGGPNVYYESRAVTPEDVARIRPNLVILAGLLHHLSDADSVALLQMCGSVSSVRRIATSDVVYLPRQHLSNLLAFFDRGKFVRDREGFLALPRRAGLRIVREEVVRSHPTNGKALYLMMTLEPGSS